MATWRRKNFMKVPEGYEIVNKDKKIDRSKQFMKLVKIIYGLTQAARQFYKNSHLF